MIYYPKVTHLMKYEGTECIGGDFHFGPDYNLLCLKPGLYFERKSTPYTQTILRTLWRVLSATNADLRGSDRADAEYKHSYNTPTFTLTFARLLKLCWPGNVDAGLPLANSPRPLRIRRLLRSI